MTAFDKKILATCVSNAFRALGKVSPNPLVGCIITKNGEILSEGIHRTFGGAHAEVEAISQATDDISGSTVYVTLEPCSHFGKTPPCADLLIQKKVARVVIGCTDPNPLVSGKGIQKLRAAGIEVEVLDNEYFKGFYRRFTKYITTDLPFVTIKSALTLDGKIAEKSGKSKWITGEKSRKYVHVIRSKHDAILTSSKTVLSDDPLLTVRYNNRPSPKRVMMTSKLFFRENYNFFRNTDQKSYILTLESEKNNTEVLQFINWFQIPVFFVNPDKNGKPDLKEALKKLHEIGITSVMVEAGRKLTAAMINAELFDELVLFIAPKLMGEGIKLFDGLKNFGLEKAMNLKMTGIRRLDNDAALFFARVDQ